MNSHEEEGGSERRPLTISVVVPSFNRPAATTRALQSALDQTRRPDQVIVVDDASDPPLAVELRARDALSVELIRLDSNVGASAARQVGIDAATGDLIAFLDSDDIWAPRKLEAQFALLSRYGSDALLAVACGWDQLFENGTTGRPRIPRASSTVMDFASGCWFCPGTTTIVSKRAFDIVGPFDGSLRRLEDFDWFMRFGIAGGRVVVEPQILATIAKGRRATWTNVKRAEATIMSKLGSLQTEQRAEILRRTRAYIALERARAALNERQIFGCVALLVRSFAAFPRLTVQVQPWWAKSPQAGRKLT